MLGTVKFLFPNKHDVYMHDTTQKNLFAQDGARREPWLHAGAEPATARRCSCCITIRAGSAGKDRIGAASGDDNHVQLKTHIPVYITYFTLKVNDDGSVSTYNDIYGHDAQHGCGAVRQADILRGATPQPTATSLPASGTERPGGKRKREAFDNDFTRALFGF